MKTSLSMLLAAILAATKAHAYLAIEFQACYNVAGPMKWNYFFAYPQGFDDTPDDDVFDGSCEYPVDISALPWTCELSGYTGTVESTTGGCNNQIGLGEGTIETPSGEIVDVMSDSRCEALPCKEIDLCVFQTWRCDI